MNQLTAKEKREVVAELKEQAHKQLLRILEEGKFRVFCKLNHVSASGMARSISLYVATEAGSIQYITGYVCNLLELKRDKHDGITVKGCGFDAGLDLVMRVGRRLYDEDYKLKHIWL